MPEISSLPEGSTPTGTPQSSSEGPHSASSDGRSCRLSRQFQTFPSDEKMSKCEERIKSVGALTLGIIPFLTLKASLPCLRLFASIGTKLEKRDPSIPIIALQVVNNFLGITTGALAIGAAKTFALGQTAIWGKFVKKPTGDGENTRLAQYGASELSTQDFQNLVRVFLTNSSQGSVKFEDDLSLKEWSQITI